MTKRLLPGEKFLEIYRSTFLEDSNISNAEDFNQPQGWAVRELQLYFKLIIDIDTVPNGGVSMTTLDEAVQALAQFSVDGHDNILNIKKVPGEEFAYHARMVPPRTDEPYVFAYAEGGVPTAGGGPVEVDVILPLLYPNVHYPGGEYDRWPTELLNAFTHSIKTRLNADWVTLGAGGSVTGQVILRAAAIPATKLVLPAPYELAKESVNAGVKTTFMHNTYHHECIFRQQAVFTGSDKDLLKIGGNDYYDANMDHRELRTFYNAEQTALLDGTQTLFPHSEFYRVMGGRSEHGDEILKNVSKQTKVTYQPQSATTMYYRRRRRWDADVLKFYSEALPYAITGGQHVGPNKGDVADYNPDSTLPLITGITL